MNTIGFIGLGIMGLPMAKNLMESGQSLLVYDIDGVPVQKLVAAGAKEASVADIAANCHTVFTILPNDIVVEQVILGEDGLLPNLRPGSLVVDMSSITPGLAKRCAAALQQKGCSHIDAPVSGGEQGAIDATLVFIAGAQPEDFERAKPYFDIMGSSATLVGGNGLGSLAKLTNQSIVNLNIAAVSEAFVLLTKAGGNPEAVYRAIRGGLAGSAVLDAKIPKIIARDFQAGGKLSINKKDIGNVLSTAREYEVPMPLTSMLMEIMTTLKNHGHIEEDHAGIVHFFENLAGVEVTQQPEK